MLIYPGAQSDAWAAEVKRAFGAATFVTRPSKKVSLALGSGTKFDSWARERQLPALSIGSNVLGPLALPGRPGCGFCARARVAAAAATARSMSDSEETTWSPGGLAAGFLEELHTVFDRPLHESHLIDHVLLLDPGADFPALHRFVPLPWCPTCGGAAASTERPPAPPLDASASPAELLAQLAGWVDRRTGVVSLIAVEQGDAPVTMTAAPPHIVEVDGALRQLPVGWGKGVTLSAAILSTVGETIERYSASLPDPARIVWKRPAELAGDVLDPGDRAPYTAEQYARSGFPFVPFDREVEHPWIRGQWLGSGEPVWVPAVFAYLTLAIRPEHHIVQGTSNGLAAGASFDDAAMRATMELVERDAFMRAWRRPMPGRRIELDQSLPPELVGVLDAIRTFGARVELYLLEDSLCGTAILALALGDGVEYPGATIGIGADPDPQAALRSAILELGQTGPHLRRLMRSGSVTAAKDPTAVCEMIDHAAFYFPPQRAQAFDRIRCGAEPIAWAEVAQRSTRIPAMRVALVDVTSPDVATGPFRVVRAVSPDLEPISYGYGLDRAGSVPVQPGDIHPIW